MSQEHATRTSVRAMSVIPRLRRLAPAVLTLVIVAGCGGGGGGGSSAAPTAAPDSYSTAAGQTTLAVSSPGVLANDNTGGGLVTAELWSPPAHYASFALNADGSFTYVHDNASSAVTDSFTYRLAKNGSFISGPATVTIHITPPVAAADTYGIAAPGGTISVSAPGVLSNDTGTGLTAELGSSLPAHAASFTFNSDGSFSYVHDGSSATTDSFTYDAKIGAIVSNTATVTINIAQPPVASNTCVSTPVNTIVTGQLSATDPQGQPLTYTLLTTGGKGAVNLDGAGNFAYTPNSSSFRGMDKFTYQVTNTSGLTATGSAWVFIDGAMRIMALGDSITQGIFNSGGCDPDGDCPVRNQRIGFRKKVWSDLEALSPSYAVRMVGGLADGSAAGLTQPNDQHEGHPGDCAGPLGGLCTSPDEYNMNITNNLSDNILGWLNANPPDIILLHVGTNGLNFDTATANAADVDTLLQDIDSWAQANYPITVFLARIIPAVDGSLDVNTFNDDIAAIPASHHPHINVIMVDEQSQLQLTGYPNQADPAYMTSGNNLHPNQTGYDLMATKWEADMQSAGVLPSCP